MIPFATLATACVIASASPVSTWTDPVTDRSCPDIAASSPNGKYRFQSTHPNNSLPHPQPSVCTGFTIRLMDTTDGWLIWERVQDKNEIAAHQGWVSNGGRVVVDAGTFHLLGARDGRPRYSWNPDDLLTEADRKYIAKRETAAGVETNELLLVHRQVLEYSHGLYFTTRYFWGKQTFIDMEKGAPVSGPSSTLNRAAEAAERQSIRRVLRSAAVTLGEVKDWDAAECKKYGDMASEVETAAFIAGQMRAREATPELRKLEECGYYSRVGAGVGAGQEWPGHPTGKLFSVRRAAHLALRRMGEPAGLQPSYALTGSGRGWRAPEAGKAMERARLATWVKLGMRAEEIYEQAGSPEWADELAETVGDTAHPVLWEYDIDGAQPSTLQVYFGGEGTVTKVENVRPATYVNGFRRDVGDW